MLRLEKVTKRFGEKTVLENLDLHVPAAGFVTITGPSGAGKSTILKLLIGDERPSEGSVFFEDREVHRLQGQELQELRRKIGMVFQDYKLLPNRSVFENLAFVLEVCDYPLYEIPERVFQLLKRVSLEPCIDRYPYQLSGGEAQRVALARALAHNPPLLLADEPTGNLDPENAMNVMKILLELNRQGLTVLLTTHAPELLRMAPKNIYHLEKGRLTRKKCA